jgi:hypothetical protein
MNWLWNTFFANRAPVWTAAATVVLVVFSGLLWKVSDRTNETSITSQRAFISFSGPYIVADVKDKKMKGTNVYWVMANSGTTPADGVVIESNMSLGQAVPEKGIDFDGLPQTERQKLVLGPKGSYQFKPLYLSIEDWDAIANAKEHLFFWGWVTYHDIFNGTPERLSEFCTDITKVNWNKEDHSDPTGGINTINPPCPTHNCYDEECEDYNERTK